MTRSAPWQRAALVALVIYPAVMIILATMQGPGISADSVSYAAAATSFADSGRFVTYDGSALTLFPPGLPAVLGVLVSAGVSLSVATVAVNVVATCVTVVASYVLARQVLSSPGWSLAAAAAVCLLAATVRVGSYLWTEALFTALITVTLALITWAVRHRRAPWWLVVASGVLVALATVVRFVGVVAVPVVVVAIALSVRDRRVVKAGVAGALAALGLVVVAIRNVSLDAPVFGERYPGSQGLEGALFGVVLQWGEYIAPSRTTTLTVVVGAIVGLVILSGIWLVIVGGNRPGIVAASLVAVYWLAIVVSQVGTRLDAVTERFAAPVLAPTVVLFLVATRSIGAVVCTQLASMLTVSRARVRRGVTIVVGVIAALVVGLSIVHAVEFVRESSRDGIELASNAAKERTLAQVAASLPADVVVASNDPWQVWWSRGGVVLDFPPSRSEWPSERVEADLAALANAVSAHGRVLALIDEGARASIELSDLQGAGLTAQVLQDADDVVVAEVTRD